MKPEFEAALLDDQTLGTPLSDIKNCPVHAQASPTGTLRVCGQAGCGTKPAADMPGGIPAPICVVGMNHVTAPLDVRSRVGISDDAVPEFLQACRARGVAECVVISTCNRTDVYFAGGEAPAIVELLAERAGLPVDDLRMLIYEKHCVCAACHLFKVSAGLDSAILGETEIVAQVKDAWRAAELAGTSGPMLDFVFQRAMEANKRIRTESHLSRNVTSTASLAVQAVENIKEASVVLLGAGRLGQRVAKELVSAGATDISILNRTLERAEILASKPGMRPLPMSELESELTRADVVFATLSADEPLLAQPLMARVSTARGGRPLLLIDLGVPRNVEDGPAAAGVHVVNLDSLVAMSSANAELRMAAIPVALQILDEELHRFGEALVERSAAPTIKSLVARGEQIKRRNVEWARERLPDLSEKELHVVEEMARRMMLGLLQAPIDGLKSDPVAREHRHVVERLFGLEQGADA